MSDVVCYQLQYLFVRNGKSLLDDPDECYRALLYFCPKSTHRQVDWLITALREGFPQQLLNINSSFDAMEELMRRMTELLQTRHKIPAPKAHWTVETWAFALGILMKARVIPPNGGIEEALTGGPEQFAGWRKVGVTGETLPVNAFSWAAVIDEKRQLMWAVNAEKKACVPNRGKRLMWPEAGNWVEALNGYGWCGYNDWRLPTREEVESLIVPATQGCLQIRQDIFTDIHDKFYSLWSSSPCPGYENCLWVVHFHNGSTDYGPKGRRYFVRLVRSC